MEQKPYPAIPLASKFGTVEMSFHSARTEQGTYHSDGQNNIRDAGALCSVSGHIKINGVDIRLAARRYDYRMQYSDERGHDLATPLRVFRARSKDSYQYKGEGNSYALLDWKGKYHKRLREEFDEEVRTAYEARPDLQKEAERVFLENVVITKSNAVEDAREKLDNAEAELHGAQAELDAYDGKKRAESRR